MPICAQHSTGRARSRRTRLNLNRAEPPGGTGAGAAPEIVKPLERLAIQTEGGDDTLHGQKMERREEGGKGGAFPRGVERRS